MKLVKMFDHHERFKSKKVLYDALNVSPTKALNLDDIVARCKVMRIVNVSAGDLVLEDPDHAALKAAIEAYPWGMADPALLDILLAVRDAPKAPEGVAPSPEGAVPSPEGAVPSPE